MAEEMRNDGHEPATKTDLRDGLNALRDDLRGEFRSELSAQIHGVRTDLGARLDSHDKRLDAIDGNLHRLNVAFARMEGDMAELKGKVDILLVAKEEISRFGSNLERVATHFESSVRKMDSQGSMLMEHEARLTKLESRPQ